MPATLSDLKARVLDYLDNNTQLYTDSELTSVINESVRVINVQTGYLQGVVNIPGGTVANRLWYDVPTSIFLPLRVQVNGFYLQRTGLNAIGQRDPLWTTKTSVISGSAPTEWISCGIKKFALYPADSLASETLTVTGVLEPTLLVNDTDEVQLQDEFTQLLVDIAAHTIQIKEGGKILADSMNLFNKALAKLQRMSKYRSDSQPYLRPEATIAA